MPYGGGFSGGRECLGFRRGLRAGTSEHQKELGRQAKAHFHDGLATVQRSFPEVIVAQLPNDGCFGLSLSPNMWGSIGAFILRYRIPIAIVMLAITAGMGYMAQFVRMNYKFSGVLPKDDSTFVDYERFIGQFSEDGNVLAIGFRDSSIWELENFTKWRALGDSLRSVKVPVTNRTAGGKTIDMRSAVDSVFSAAHCYTLVRNDSLQRFDFVKLGSGGLQTQADADSIRSLLYNLPFYEDILYRKETDAGLMMVFVNKEIFDSNNRGDAVDRMVSMCDRFTETTGIRTYISGLPFIRDETMKRVKGELNFFTGLSAII